MDPAKLKVVELRAELQSRGLDTKGNKPVLVKRLKEALEAELETDLPDTSIADTSTEECNSQDEDCMVEEKPAKSDTEVKTPEEVKETDVVLELPTEPASEVAKEAEIETAPEPEAKPVEDEPVQEEKTEEPMVVEKTKEDNSETHAEAEAKPEQEQEPSENITDEPKCEEANTETVEQNGAKTNGDAEEETCEPKAKKSRWGTDTETVVATADDQEPTVPDGAFNRDEPQKQEQEERGDKRKHSSPSPERNQRARSKSPIREDEPAVDANKVQLSWYDSDLHLQIDKSNFLSAKPLNDGLFGYIWSGARVTHGVKADKACFEVKIVEELRFEDILSSVERRDNRRERKDGRKDENRERSRAKSENGSEKTSEKSDPIKMETEDSKPEASEKTTSTETEPAKDDSKAESKLEVKEDAMDVDKSAIVEKVEESKQNTEDEIKSEKSEKDDSVIKEIKEEKKTEKPLVKIPSHLIRIGWSHANSSLQLGEDKVSYGLESSGKFYANNTSVETEATFKVGDVIKAFVDMTKCELVFAINGVVAFTYQIELSDEEKGDDFALFPHILTRNLTFEVNTGDSEEALSATPEGFEDYKFVAKLDETVNGVRTPEKREDCEVIMMCGLPSSGKTHWVTEHLKTTEKKYNIVGSSFLIDRMTVDCKPIRSSIGSDRMGFFWNKLEKSINRLCDIAPLRRRDFILDQTNVFPTAIRRKMRSFLGFKRHAVIVVNDDEEQEKRVKQQDPETGKEMSVSALLEMKANMGLPKVGDNLEQATYVSLPEDKALEQVQKYNKQGRDGGYGNISHHRRDNRDDRNNRWHHRGSGGGGGGPRRDYHHKNNYRDRPYQNNRYDRNYRQSSSGGGSWRPGGGGGGGNWGSRNDRRDNRPPRDFRNNSRSGGMSDRSQSRGSNGGNRDHRNHSSSGGGGGNYNRNRNQNSGGGRWGGQSGGWNNQSGGSGGGSWGGSGGGGQSQDWNTGWNQSQGSWNQNQWKYGGGYNQGGYSQYPQNWNSGYYGGGGGSYAQQEWSGTNSGGQSGGGSSSSSSAPAASSTTHAANNSSTSYAPSSSMMAGGQQAWSQYTQQYTPGATSNTNAQK